MSKNKLIELIDTFTTLQDISVAHANEIELAIDDEFPDDEYMQDVVEMLASYRPGGGDYLYDEQTVINKLLNVKAKL